MGNQTLIPIPTQLQTPGDRPGGESQIPLFQPRSPPSLRFLNHLRRYLDCINVNGPWGGQPHEVIAFSHQRFPTTGTLKLGLI